MPEQVRFGVVGTSGWAEAMFLPSINSHPAGRVVAICGRNRARGEALAANFAIPQVFTDYRVMIADGGLDAIVVASPDDLHYPMTLAALEAGLHVLCEKPLALTVAQARAMTDRAEAAGVKHMVLFTWRWQPQFQYLKQLVDDGFIGRPYQANFRFISGFGRTPAYSWRVDSQRANGVASDLGAHMIDFAHWFVGDISHVGAHLKTHVQHSGPDGGTPNGTNDGADITLAFANGAQGLIQVSTVSHQADRVMSIALELYGTEGTLEATYVPTGSGFNTSIRGARQDEEQFATLAIPPNLRANVDLRDPFAVFREQNVGPRLFIESILGDRPVEPNFHDGLKVQQVIAAVLQADREERRIAVAR